MENQEKDQDQQSQIKPLPPWGIDLESCKTDDEIKNGEKAFNSWLETISKEVHEILKKHDVNAYQISFKHPCIQIPIVLAKGHSYTVTKLAAHATMMLKERVDQELKI